VENAAFVVYQRRFSASQRTATEDSRRILNVQLKELESHELVGKIIYPVVPPKVEYYLTDFGKSLIPVIGAIGQWGDANDHRLRTLILRNIGS
jgi:DNA-binding HxlR family transcriptional regulator